MTVIAWDGLSLAADRRAISAGMIREITKIRRVGEALVGYSGDAAFGEELLAWFERGAEPANFPESLRGKDDWACLMAVWPDRTVWLYERTPHPIKFPPQNCAIGSGRDYAMAAMHLGESAAEAVRVASLFDSGCGNGVDVLRFDE